MNVDALAGRGRGLGAGFAVIIGLLLGAPAMAHAALSVTTTPASPRPGEPVTFTPAGTTDGACLAWNWEVVGAADPFASGFNNPAAGRLESGFATTGTFTVTLTCLRTVSFAWVVEAEKRVTVVANRPPTASFTVDPASPQAGQTVTFTDTSTDPEADVLTRAWDTDNDGAFDDGSGATATRAFATIGPQTVRLRVRDAFGAASITTGSVTTTNGPPSIKLDVTPTTPATGEQVTFSVAASDPDGGPVTYAWDLDGDGEYDDETTATPPPRSYPRAGTRTVGVRVTDDDGDPATSVQTRSATITVTNRPPTTPTITATRVGQDVELQAAATDPEGTTLTYAWDLNGDGGFDDAFGSTVTRPFPVAGVLVARAQVTDLDGGVAASDAVTIAPEPQPAPDPIQTLTPTPVVDLGAAAGTSVSAPTAAATATTAALPPRRSSVTPVRLLRPFPRVRITGRLTARGARLTRLTITAPRGSRVEATCDGRGCPRRRASATAGRSGTVQLHRLLGSYRAGTRLIVRVTRSGAVGKYTQIVVRRGRPPARVDRCLRPGAVAPTRCPAN